MEASSDVAVVGAGVVGCAAALALARRGASVALLEAESAPGLAASGTNSGILHTGFDSVPGELETELIVRSAALRDPVLEAFDLAIVRCGAVLRPRNDDERAAVRELAANAAGNGVHVALQEDGALSVPGEAICDPVAYTAALAAAAQRHGAALRTSFRVGAMQRGGEHFRVEGNDGTEVRCRVLVNCAGLYADQVARLGGDESFEIYPRKGEFLVFDPPAEPLEEIRLPVPSKRTKGVLVFPTVDGKVVAGPTAVDGDDKTDWTVRAEARDEIVPKAAELLPELEGAEPIAAYAGLRPAGRGVNYVIGASRECPGLVNVAAIRSTGVTASLGIAEHVTGIIGELGVELGPEAPLETAPPTPSETPWWRSVAEYRGVA
ncbi:MAG: FAD-dependent oxidoreductase [Actinomycetota bacterium]